MVENKNKYVSMETFQKTCAFLSSIKQNATAINFSNEIPNITMVTYCKPLNILETRATSMVRKIKAIQIINDCDFFILKN